MSSSIVENLKRIQQEISALESKYHREHGSVTLVAVSKKQPIDAILQAHKAGQKAFGESFLQEALFKIESLKNQSIEWHFIGNIQANKTKKIAENFSWVHSVSRIKIAARLNEQRPKHLPPLNICIQVNLTEKNPQSCVSVNHIMTLIKEIKKYDRLHLCGLMTMLPAIEDKKHQFELFSQMKSLQEKLKQEGYSLNTLSMGMSNDYEAAIRAGSTMVRIGTAIFGKRK